MLNPANIIRSRRRTLSLFINPNGELVVKAPLNLSDKRISEFVKTKEKWILAQQKRVLQTQYLNKSVLTYRSFLYLGHDLLPLVCNKSKKILRQEDNLLVPAKWAGLEEEKVLKKIKKWLTDEAKIILDERVQFFAAKLNLRFATFCVNNNKTRWGSCSRDGRLAINWRAVMLPPRLLDYIVVHEFCHLLEFNHSKQFWHILSTIIPNWKDLRIQLKNHNWLLNLFR